MLRLVRLKKKMVLFHNVCEDKKEAAQNWSPVWWHVFAHCPLVGLLKIKTIDFLYGLKAWFAYVIM